MRTLPSLLSAAALAAALSGCTISPDVLTADQAAGNAERQVGAAERGLAVANAQTVSTLAAAYVSETGSVAGFAADLRQYEPGIAAKTYALSDTSVSFSIAPGTCLVQPLPSGAPAEAPC